MRPSVQPASRPARRRLISLTPLIDVVFILLIFFMLASRLDEWRSLRLGGGRGGPATADPAGALLVEVRSDGLRLAGELLTTAELLERVRRRLAEMPTRRILVRPAPGVDLQATVAVLDGLAAAGAADLALLQAGGP